MSLKIEKSKIKKSAGQACSIKLLFICMPAEMGYEKCSERKGGHSVA